MKIELVGMNLNMCNTWENEFKGCDDVTIICGDFFEPETDCIVSPANFFGFIDGVITRRLVKLNNLLSYGNSNKNSQHD